MHPRRMASPRLVTISGGLLMGVVLVAVAAARFEPILAVLPAAAIFGWTQVGGL